MYNALAKSFIKHVISVRVELKNSMLFSDFSYIMISKIRSLMTTFNIIQPKTGQKITFCQLSKDLTENRKLVYFGEIHSQPAIINLQNAVFQSMVEHANKKGSKIHLFLEHFSIQDQTLIDEYLNNSSISEEDLERKYLDASEEGHDISTYFPILKFAKDNTSAVTVNGSFIPR